MGHKPNRNCKYLVYNPEQNVWITSSGFKNHLVHFAAQPTKNKTIRSPKNFLYFQNWNVLALILKKTLISPEEEAFSFIFSKKNFLHFAEIEPCTFRSDIEK